MSEKYLFLAGKSDSLATAQNGGIVGDSNSPNLSVKVNAAAEKGFTLVSAGSMDGKWDHPLYAVMVKVEED